MHQRSVYLHILGLDIWGLFTRLWSITSGAGATSVVKATTARLWDAAWFTDDKTDIAHASDGIRTSIPTFEVESDTTPQLHSQQNFCNPLCHSIMGAAHNGSG